MTTKEKPLWADETRWTKKPMSAALRVECLMCELVGFWPTDDEFKGAPFRVRYLKMMAKALSDIPDDQWEGVDGRIQEWYKTAVTLIKKGFSPPDIGNHNKGRPADMPPALEMLVRRIIGNPWERRSELFRYMTKECGYLITWQNFSNKSSFVYKILKLSRQMEQERLDLLREEKKRNAQ